MAGVGHATEQRLWRNGYQSWDHLWQALNSGWSSSDVLRDRFVQTSLFDDLGPRQKHPRTLAWLDCLDESRQSWKKLNYRFFTDLLRPSDQWRLLTSVMKDALFLDIETTGLSSDLHYATVIGALYQGMFHQWVWPQPLDELRELLQSARILVTFNGRRFDVPFLQSHVPDLTFPDAHIDLLYIASAAALKGGQKVIEEKLGLKREDGIRDLSGREAVLAWCSGLYGDQKAYRQLLKYNRADVEMMPQLATRLCSKLASSAKNVLEEPLSAASVRTKIGHKPSDYSALHEAWEKHRPGLHLLKPKLLRRFGSSPRIVGIDLRGKPTNPTGWAICEGTRAETCILYSDEEIIAKTLAAKADLVSIDAPLALPRGRKSAFDDSPCRKEGGIVRDAERILWARGVGVYPALIPHMQKLTLRGMQLTKELESHGLKVIESYPGAAQDVLGIPRKKSNEDLLTRGLHEFGFDFGGDKSHDELDAITSALVGYFYLADEYEAIGADDECYMIIPTRNSMSWRSQPSPAVVSLIGLPGAGKSTLTRALAARLGWDIFALGDSLRTRALNDVELSRTLDDGSMAPESLVLELVEEAANRPIGAGLLVDGFPRHELQVVEARRLFEHPIFLFLDADPELAVQRLARRNQRPEDEFETASRRVQESTEALSSLLSCLRKDRLIRLDASLYESRLVDEAIRELRITRL
jgi:uncharacterized protein YprB with RNaseH-like and TPR domain/predicted nuclease with RNAse H fold/adenylate kinase family enzyme